MKIILFSDSSILRKSPISMNSVEPTGTLMFTSAPIVMSIPLFRSYCSLTHPDAQAITMDAAHHGIHDRFFRFIFNKLILNCISAANISNLFLLVYIIFKFIGNLIWEASVIIVIQFILC